MKRMIGIMEAAALMLAAGCARFSTTQTDLSYEEGQPAREITTHATASTFFAGKSSLASWKASQTDKTQGDSVGNLELEANARTNLNALVESVVGAAVKAAVRP
ncbi:MAG: hypothetical protein WCO56_03770 [Verrucomicrobiota bacterium]